MISLNIFCFDLAFFENEKWQKAMFEIFGFLFASKWDFVRKILNLIKLFPQNLIPLVVEAQYNLQFQTKPTKHIVQLPKSHHRAEKVQWVWDSRTVRSFCILYMRWKTRKTWGMRHNIARTRNWYRHPRRS